MSNNATETIIGVGVVAVAVAFLFYAANAVGFSSATDEYELRASFRSADGISLGTEVRLAGVKIGSVSDLSLNKESFRADTTFKIDTDIIIPDDSAVLVSSEGLLGGNFVEIIPGGSPFNLENGGEIEDTQGSVSLVSLLMKFVSGQDK